MTTETKQTNDQKLITGTGRRKTAVARIFLYEKKGEFTVNDKPIKDYFPSELEQSSWLRPFHTIGVAHPESKFSATIKIFGSGKNAQMGALIHGLSHALSKMSEEWSMILRKQGFLTRDPRMVERKKPGLHKARKATQYSKR
jgi:small subunit ribosomal protein S9